MNRIHSTFAVAFFLGGLAVLGVWELAVPTVAAAQVANPLLAQRLNQIERRVAMLEAQASNTSPRAQRNIGNGETSAASAANQGGPIGQFHPAGGPNATSPALNNAQVDQVIVLQGQVDALKNQLQKLQKQFATHYHTVLEGHSPGFGVNTILTCGGYGKPCVSATSLTEVTVLVPSNITASPAPTPVQSSGPVMSGN